MSETSVVLGLSHSLQILSHGSIEVVGDQLGVGALSGVLLSVQEPLGDVIVGWSCQDVVHGLDLVLGHLAGSLVEVDLGDLESEDGKSAAHTSDHAEAEGSLLFTGDVSVLDSENVSEFVWVLQNQGGHIPFL